MSQLGCPLIREVSRVEPQGVEALREMSSCDINNFSDGDSEPQDSDISTMRCQVQHKSCPVMMLHRSIFSCSSALEQDCQIERGSAISALASVPCRRGPNLHPGRQREPTQPRRRVSSVDSLKITDNVEEVATCQATDAEGLLSTCT